MAEKEKPRHLKERKCEECGSPLTDEDVMKIKTENDAWEIIPLPVCPNCFKKQMRELANARIKSSKRT